MRKLSAILSIAALAWCAAYATESLVEAEKHGTKKEAAYYIRMFESPDRLQWQKPDEVVKALGLKSGDRIADIGAGSGYFTRRFARAVAPDGIAIGYDVDAGMVAFMKEDAAKNGIGNYCASLISPDRPELEKSSFDLIFICNTYHHIENRIAYLKRLKAALKKKGRVAIVDYRKSSKSGPPASFKLDESMVVEEFSKAGFRVLKKHDFLSEQYFIEFVQ